MSSQAPLLTRGDIEAELAAIHAHERRSMTTALHGRADPLPERVAVRDRELPVAIARCEIEIRRALAHAEGDLVLLVDYGLDLPLDVAARVAGGRVYPVARDRRLARLFGASGASPDLLASPLAVALLEDPDGGYGPIAGATLDLETAWKSFLQNRAGLPVEGALSEERIVAFCATSERGPAFQRYVSRWQRLPEALLAFLEGRSGPIAKIAWRAWQRDRGREVAALAIVLDVAAAEAKGNGYLRGVLSKVLVELDPELREVATRDHELLHRWGQLGPRLLLRLRPDEIESLVADADRALADPEVAIALASSRILPSAFEQARGHLARALVKAASDPSRAAFEVAREALEKLESHRLRDSERYGASMYRARMAVRLLAYRATRAGRPDVASLARDGPAYEEMVLLAEHYVREGGFVDYARRVARGGAADALGEAVQGVVATVDALRDEDDLRFARGLEAWLQAGRKADRLVPADQALDRFAVEFLKARAHRKLLVLLLDGMAWPNTVELLLDLEQRRWAPIRWRPKGADPRGLLPPMMAALPTVTEVSRSALFQGRLLEPGERTNAARDPTRFGEHQRLRSLLGEAPRLLLRHDLQTSSGDVSKQALEIVESDDRIVAVVVNAIDDQLKAGRQMRVEYTVAAIKPLADLLERATLAGRAVLLLADHGHVSGARMEPTVSRPSEGGTRWRIVDDAEEPREHELAPRSDAVWHPPHKRVAMLVRETDTFGTLSHEGEHGGASLSEAVAPAVLIASDDLARRCAVEDRDDPELELTPLPRPSWWDLRLAEAQAAAPPPPRAKKRKAKTAPQIEIPFTESAGTAGSVVAQRLLRAEVFRGLSKEKRDLLREVVVPRVGLLVDHDGVLLWDAFATGAGILRFRVPGAVAQLAEFLNLDGYPVVALDQAAGQVRLDLGLLENLFPESE